MNICESVMDETRDNIDNGVEERSGIELVTSDVELLVLRSLDPGATACERVMIGCETEVDFEGFSGFEDGSGDVTREGSEDEDGESPDSVVLESHIIQAHSTGILRTYVYKA